jgi:hypothetical protein
MSALRTALRKLVGLFVDDGWLAATTLGVVSFTGAIRLILPAHPLLAGLILVVGCLGALAAAGDERTRP